MNGLRALTLHRPWSHAISHGRKRVENRSWAWHRGLQGKLVAIHAGSKYDEDAADWMRLRRLHDAPDAASCPTGIVAVARLVACVTTGTDPWFCGPYGWVLRDVWQVGPVACPGQQGLWEVTGDVLERLRAAWPSRRPGLLERPEPCPRCGELVDEGGACRDLEACDARVAIREQVLGRVSLTLPAAAETEALPRETDPLADLERRMAAAELLEQMIRLVAADGSLAEGQREGTAKLLRSCTAQVDGLLVDLAAGPFVVAQLSREPGWSAVRAAAAACVAHDLEEHGRVELVLTETKTERQVA